MLETLGLETTRDYTGNAFHRQLIPSWIAMAIGLGLTTCANQSISFAQFQAGDLPASPWSKSVDARQTQTKSLRSSSSNERLRQPKTLVQPVLSFPPAATVERRSVERQVNEASRPAAVTLMEPMLPDAVPFNSTNQSEQALPSTIDRPLEFLGESKNPALSRNETISQNQTAALPWHALTQKMPIKAQSDWHRVQAGGLILNDDSKLLAESLEHRPDSPREQMASSGNRSIEPGLPDRENNNAVQMLASQMASSKSPTTKPSFVPSVQEVNPIAENDPDASFEERALTGQDQRSTSKPTVNDFESTRIALAQRVSHERLSDGATSQSRAPEILESLPGWQSIERELKQRLERCDSLLKRGAVLSAREETSQGLLRLYRTMDLHRGHIFSEPAFDKAMIAIREEADFQKILGGSGVQAIVDNHTTDVLKNRPLDSTSPEMAAMHYRWYARYQLVAASDGHPWAADLLYAYGRTLEKDAEFNPARAVMFRNQAVILYQAATQTKPTQSEAANQLGFVLIHLDRIDDAYTALAASIQIKPNANAWNNLAEVFRQRGAPANAEYASQQAAALVAGNPQYSPENPEVTEVDPALFAKYSPMPVMASSSQNFTPSNVTTSVSNGSGSSVRNASSGNSLFSKILR